MNRTLFRPSRCALLAVLYWFSATSLARAQSYPDRPIRIVVPFAAGGGSDVVGRAIAQKLSEKLGQSVVVENRTGAGGSLGATQVALQLAIPTMSAVLPHAGGGKLKILAVSTVKRAMALPEIPTVHESGVPGYATGLWTGLLAPTDTPAPIVARLHAAVSEALASPDLKETLAGQGAERSGGTPEQFAEEIRRELAVWRDLVKQTGIRID